MQYLLTQEEYDELTSIKRSIQLENTQKLQKLCSKIADEMPIKFWNNKEAEPWGCILTKLNDYCDECPVQEICRHPYKKWSK